MTQHSQEKPKQSQTPQQPTQLWEQPPPPSPTHDVDRLGGNDGVLPAAPVVPVPNVEVYVQPRPISSPNRHPISTKKLAVASLALLGVGGALSAYSLFSKQAPATPEYVQPAPKTTLDKINDAGRDLASGVITILARPGSGADAFGGQSIGNKEAVVGPDGVSDTKDDLTKAPEAEITFDAAEKKIYVLSSQGYKAKGSNDKTATKEWSHVFAVLELKDGNPILSIQGQPTLDDFRKAVSAENPLTVDRLEAELRIGGIQPAPSVEFTTEDNAQPHISVDELSQGSDSRVTEADASNATFDDVAERLVQVTYATVQDLTKQ